MNIYRKADCTNPAILNKIQQGAVFISPTDTIYGLSCDATNNTAVERIRTIKQRPTQPLSIWAPSKEWIIKNCRLTSKSKKWLDKLPGPYTLLLTLKNTAALAPNVTCGQTTIGVRIPDHWFSDVVKKINIPLITTSANIHSEPHMTSLETLNPLVKSKVDFVIYEGEKTARPSTIVDVENETVKER